MKDREASEEIVYDIFLTLWTERARLQIQVFPAYLGAAVRYQAVWYRRTISPLRYADALDTLSTTADYNYGETQLLGLDLEHRLAAALDQLPQRCRELFLLSRMQRFSNDETAERLHIKYLGVLWLLTVVSKATL